MESPYCLTTAFQASCKTEMGGSLPELTRILTSLETVRHRACATAELLPMASGRRSHAGCVLALTKRADARYVHPRVTDNVQESVVIKRKATSSGSLGTLNHTTLNVEPHSFDNASSTQPFAPHMLLPISWVEAIGGKRRRLPKGGEQRGRDWCVPRLTCCSRITIWEAIRLATPCNKWVGSASQGDDSVRTFGGPPPAFAGLVLGASRGRLAATRRPSVPAGLCTCRARLSCAASLPCLNQPASAWEA